MANFELIFGLSLVLTAGVTFRSSDNWKKYVTKEPVTENEEDAPTKKQWVNLLSRYLLVYLLATLSDWLQGPYVYALYSDYGYAKHDIAVLFVAGFGSSMIFGTFIGGMADQFGRRLFVVIYGLTYAASCFTKHFKHFGILMLGRLLGGIATSLLFSIFEAWLIRSHADSQLKNFLGKSFSWAAFSNSIVAILTGLIANKAAGSFSMTAIQEEFLYIGGYLSPFDMALITSLLTSLAAYMTWEENYGDRDDSADGSKEGNAKWYEGLRSAYTTMIRSEDILLCGAISSLFEGSMYVFVFMWTPALSGVDVAPLPFGLIFATFMVCCMAGSSIFSIFSDKIKGEFLGIVVFGVASFAMGVVAFFSGQTMKFLGMNLFEMTVGMYFPIMGTLKGAIVPESKRAGIYNLFRIPLNFIVLFSLLTDLAPQTSFTLNCFMLLTATGLQYRLMKRREGFGLTESEIESTKALMEPQVQAV